MKTAKKFYSKEFKQKAVALSHERGNVSEVSKELGVRFDLLSRWRREYSKNPESSFSGKGKPVRQLSDELKEIARLKKELASVSMERDILKKAVAIFSKRDSIDMNL